MADRKELKALQKKLTAMMEDTPGTETVFDLIHCLIDAIEAYYERMDEDGWEKRMFISTMENAVDKMESELDNH
jgi:hypothetical protein